MNNQEMIEIVKRISEAASTGHLKRVCERLVEKIELVGAQEADIKKRSDELDVRAAKLADTEFRLKDRAKEIGYKKGNLAGEQGAINAQRHELTGKMQSVAELKKKLKADTKALEEARAAVEKEKKDLEAENNARRWKEEALSAREEEIVARMKAVEGKEAEVERMKDAARILIEHVEKERASLNVKDAAALGAYEARMQAVQIIEKKLIAKENELILKAQEVENMRKDVEQHCKDDEDALSEEWDRIRKDRQAQDAIDTSNRNESERLRKAWVEFYSQKDAFRKAYDEDMVRHEKLCGRWDELLSAERELITLVDTTLLPGFILDKDHTIPDQLKSIVNEYKIRIAKFEERVKDVERREAVLDSNGYEADLKMRMEAADERKRIQDNWDERLEKRETEVRRDEFAMAAKEARFRAEKEAFDRQPPKTSKELEAKANKLCEWEKVLRVWTDEWILKYLTDKGEDIAGFHDTILDIKEKNEKMEDVLKEMWKDIEAREAALLDRTLELAKKYPDAYPELNQENPVYKKELELREWENELSEKETFLNRWEACVKRRAEAVMAADAADADDVINMLGKSEISA